MATQHVRSRFDQRVRFSNDNPQRPTILGVTLDTHNYIVGIDIGGTANKFTVVNGASEYLIDQLVELPSRVTEGPKIAIAAMRQAFEAAVQMAGIDPHDVRGVGLDTPGPASANGVLSSRGATNFSRPGWHGFDVRAALEHELGLPVVYNNDGNAAALYAHHCHFGPISGRALVGGGDRRHRPRRRRDRERPDHQGRGRDGGRARPRPHSDARAAARRPAAAALQLRVQR